MAATTPQQEKTAPPDFDEFSRLAASANFVFARYLRHFAGKDRGTRDLGLLTEMVEDLRAIRQRMSVILIVNPDPAYQRDGDVVSKMIEMYEVELREIPKAHASGTADEQAGRLAVLANAQFDLYRTHFAGLSRQTRRPALLQRMIDNLRRIRGAMKSLGPDLSPSGPVAENNRKNISIVDSSLRQYEMELAEISKSKQATSFADLLGLLGGAANDVFDEYRQKFAGRDRSTVDLSTLGVLCDKLGELARQMADIGRIEKNENNERNLSIVLEQLGDYEQEWKAVAKAQEKPELQSS